MDYILDDSIPGRNVYAFDAMNVVMCGRYNRTVVAPPTSTYTLAPRVMGFTFIIKGRQTMRVGTQDYQLRGGDVFVTFPGESFSTGDAPQEKCLFYWLHLRVPDDGSALFGLIHGSDPAMAQQLLQLHPRHFRGSAALRALLEEIHAKGFEPRSPLLSGWFSNQVVKLMFEVLACAHRKAPTVHSPPIQRVLRYIAEHLDERLSVPTLAAHAGMPVPSFKLRFKQELGLPPAEYVLRTKIDEATRRLTQRNASVTETAFALGFPTSQYFATVFKRYSGKRPSAFVPKKSASLSRCS